VAFADVQENTSLLKIGSFTARSQWKDWGRSKDLVQLSRLSP